jgi:hypothetical protein
LTPSNNFVVVVNCQPGNCLAESDRADHWGFIEIYPRPETSFAEARKDLESFAKDLIGKSADYYETLAAYVPGPTHLVARRRSASEWVYGNRIQEATTAF